jgi:hypothetical protein
MFMEIAEKATQNDIFVLFLSGHGTLVGKEFYYLTADAAAFDLGKDADRVAIGTDSLRTWMLKINAGKQVVIIDACHSGGALDGLVTKKEVPADQQRSLDLLAERTGTYLLAASAAGQSAFEMSLYSQGLLVYNLLLGMRSGQGLRDDKFLDLANWFGFTERNVEQMALGVKQRQDPQVLTPGSLDLGVVTPQVKKGIKFSSPRQIFVKSIFFNAVASDDNLHIADSVNQILTEWSYKNSPLFFYGDFVGDSICKVTGTYNLSHNQIKGQINLIKYGHPAKSYSMNVPAGNLDKFLDSAIRQMFTEL